MRSATDLRCSDANAANATTRQVEVLVDIVDKKQTRLGGLLGGLYAEGRIETDSTTSLTIPATAVVRDGDKTAAWRLKGNSLQKVSLVIGDRDPRSGAFVLRSGLAEGDQLIRHPSATLKDGQKIEMAAALATPTKAAAIETGK